MTVNDTVSLMNDLSMDAAAHFRGLEADEDCFRTITRGLATEADWTIVCYRLYLAAYKQDIGVEDPKNLVRIMDDLTGQHLDEDKGMVRTQITDEMQARALGMLLMHQNHVECLRQLISGCKSLYWNTKNSKSSAGSKFLEKPNNTFQHITMAIKDLDLPWRFENETDYDSSIGFLGLVVAVGHSKGKIQLPLRDEIAEVYAKSASATALRAQIRITKKSDKKPGTSDGLLEGNNSSSAFLESPSSPDVNLAAPMRRRSAVGGIKGVMEGSTRRGSTVANPAGRRGSTTSPATGFMRLPSAQTSSARRKSTVAQDPPSPQNTSSLTRRKSTALQDPPSPQTPTKGASRVRRGGTTAVYSGL